MNYQAWPWCYGVPAWLLNACTRLGLGMVCTKSMIWWSWVDAKVVEIFRIGLRGSAEEAPVQRFRIGLRRKAREAPVDVPQRIARDAAEAPVDVPHRIARECHKSSC